MARKTLGFTLIEIMIVVAIIGILAAIAMPNYQEYVNKGRRGDGTAAVSKVQQAQEKWRANNSSYTTNFGTAGLNLAAGATTTTLNSDEGYYSLAITGASATGYTLTATAQNKQARDSKCAKLILTVSNANAKRSAKNSADAANDTCW